MEKKYLTSKASGGNERTKKAKLKKVNTTNCTQPKKHFNFEPGQTL